MLRSELMLGEEEYIILKRRAKQYIAQKEQAEAERLRLHAEATSESFRPLLDKA